MADDDIFIPEFTLKNYQSLLQAIASGATTVSYEGKSVSYRSLDELLRLRGIMRFELGLTPRKSNTVYPAHNPGFKTSTTRDG